MFQFLHITSQSVRRYLCCVDLLLEDLNILTKIVGKVVDNIEEITMRFVQCEQQVFFRHEA